MRAKMTVGGHPASRGARPAPRAPGMMPIRLNSAMSDELFHRYRDLIQEVCSINLKPVKKPLLVNRLLKRLRQLGIEDFETYFERVTKGPNQQSEMQHLIDAITTNKTEFFREGRQWEFLAARIWPELQQYKRSVADYSIRIWSSACSSGEEPYTIAMHALEHLQGPERWNVKILASDISEKVLAVGREGTYEERRVADVPSLYLKKYFLKVPGGYKVKPEVRNLVTFRNVNLKGNFPRFVTPFDIVFCRNVIIYFDRPTQARLMERFHGCLRKGGYLFLGHSESLNGICDLYRFINASTYQKEG